MRRTKRKKPNSTSKTDVGSSSDPVYQNNVRHGNTIVVSRESSSERGYDTERVYFARRGLKHNFVVDSTQLELIDDLVSTTPNNRVGDKDPKANVVSHVFGDLNKHLGIGTQCSVNIFKASLSDGLCLHVSYDEESLCWIIGTERLSLGLQKAEDIRMYKGEGLFAIKRAAECFFDSIAKLTPTEVEELKADLVGFTLVGKYVGDYEIQQVIRYPSCDVYFHGMVPNTKDIDCYPPEEALNFIQDRKLNFVKHEICRDIRTSEEMADTLHDLVRHVEEGNIEEEDSGALLYIVLQKGEMQKVIVISELRTLEYRIYRQLKKRILEYLDSRKEANKKFEDFKEDLYAMIGDADLHHSLNYYLNIGDSAFHFCSENGSFEDFVHDYFVSFLSLVIYCMHQNQTFSPKLIKDKKKLRFVEGNNWYRYSMGNLNLRNLDNRKGLKSKKVSRESELYKRKSQQATSLSPTRVESPEPTHATSAKIEEEKQEIKLVEQPPAVQEDSMAPLRTDADVAILVPVGIPGLGFKRFFESFSKSISDLHMDISITSIDRKSDHLTVRDIETQVSASIDAARSSPDLLSIILISQALDPISASTLILKLNMLNGEKSKIKLFCVSLSSQRIEKNIPGYPFNSYTILTSIKRQLQSSSSTKSSEETVTQSIEFLKKFADSEIRSDSVKSLGFDAFIGFPFTNLDNEEAYLESAYFHTNLTTLTCILEGKEQANTLLKGLENFSTKPEWWEIKTSTGISEYQTFVLRAVSSVLKKYPLLQKKILQVDHTGDTLTVADSTTTATTATSQPAPISHTKTSPTLSTIKPKIDIHFDAKELESNMLIEDSLGKSLKPIVNENSVGKRKKPQYIGIFSKHNDERLRELLKNSALESISRLFSQVPEIKPDAKKIAAMDGWKFKEELKVTVLYIGNRGLNREQDNIYNRFSNDQPFPFLLHGIVYVPGVTIIGVTHIERNHIMMEAKYDHMTIMTTNGKPGQSSSIIEQVFSNPELRKHRENSLNTMTSVGIQDVIIEGTAHRSYLIPFRKKVLIDAITGAK